MLTGLVKDGFLEKEGETRVSIYFVKGSRQKRVFDLELETNSPDLTPGSPDLPALRAEKLSEWGLS
jgi:hypothetical protein